MRIVQMALAAACVALATPSFAQDASEARRLELADRYIALTSGPNMQKFLKTYYEEYFTEVGLPEDERAWLIQHLPPLVEEVLDATYDDLRDDVAEIFTERELELLIGFYGSAEGRAIAEKSLELSAREQQAMEPHMMSVMTELQKKFCARFDCSAEGRGLSGGKDGS